MAKLPRKPSSRPKKKPMHSSCPNCDKSWGIEEMSFQECDSCGYPRHRDREEEEQENNDSDSDWEDLWDPQPLYE